MEKNASQISQLGAGELRIHKGVDDDPNYVPVQSDGYSNLITGADLILNPDLLHRWFLMFPIKPKPPYMSVEPVGLAPNN